MQDDGKKHARGSAPFACFRPSCSRISQVPSDRRHPQKMRVFGCSAPGAACAASDAGGILPFRACFGKCKERAADRYGRAAGRARGGSAPFIRLSDSGGGNLTVEKEKSDK